MKAAKVDPIRAAKQAIRAETGAALKVMSPDDRAHATDRAFAQLAQTAAWRDARRVMLYAPMSIEPDLDRLWAHGGASLAGREVCYPRIVEHALEVRRVTALAQLRPAAFGLREPDPEVTALVDPSTLDLVIMPGLAFTRGGDRLGRGAGFYDRFLATLPDSVTTIALAFACQIRDALPIESHDRRVQFVFAG